MKAEFLMLANKYEGDFEPIGWYASTKFDGMRAFWDGGITRGMIAEGVPWANTWKDKTQRVATGLWSRYGKPIYAPNSWLDRLPKNILLDGELYCGRGQFQQTMSTCRKLVPIESEWMGVDFMVFDSPDPTEVFKNRTINTVQMKKEIWGVHQWLKSIGREGGYDSFDRPPRYDFESVLGWLRNKNKLDSLGVVNLVQQEQIENLDHLRVLMESELDLGGEGLILRKPSSFWVAQRSKNLLKMKAMNDAEGKVVGYTWGRETDKGSKLLGLMGALVVESIFDGSVANFELSGFTDEERTVVSKTTFVDRWDDYVRVNAGKPIDVSLFEVPHFPLGSTVTYRYRELTDSSVPKEARYWRKREE